LRLTGVSKYYYHIHNHHHHSFGHTPFLQDLKTSKF
jgi:hypothetical protein